jgi:hypothetical protein
MASAIFDNAMVSLMTGKVNINGSENKTLCILGGATAPNKATFATYNDVKNGTGYEIAAVNGYALGGSVVAVTTPTMTATVTGLKTSAPTVFTAGTGVTIAGSYAMIQYASSSNVATTNPLLCYLGIGAQSVTSGTLTLTWNAAGIMTLTVSAAA